MVNLFNRSVRQASPLIRPATGAFCCVLLATALAGCGSPTIEEVGGYVLVYQPQTAPHFDSQLMERAVQERLRAFAVRGATARMLADGRLEVTVPGGTVEDVKKVRRAIETVGMLEFRILARSGADDDVIAAAQAGEQMPDDDGAEASEPESDPEPVNARWINYDPDDVSLPPDAVTRIDQDSQHQLLVLLDSSNLTGAYLTAISQQFDANGNPAIGGTLSAEGAARMRRLTGENLPDESRGQFRMLGIILDDQLLSAPRILSEIGNRFQLTGNFTQEDTDFLVGVLRAGRLPARLKTDSVQIKKVEPTR